MHKKEIHNHSNPKNNKLTPDLKIDVNIFVSEIEKGNYISPYMNLMDDSKSNSLITPKDLLALDLPLVIKNLQNVISQKEELTKSDYGFDKFKKLFEEYAHHFNAGSFVNSFEAALKLRLYVASNISFNQLLSDADYSLAINAICLKITSTYFKVLENLEDKGTFDGLMPISKIGRLIVNE